MRKKMMKIKISLRRSVEKLKSRKRYFYLFVCFGIFIDKISFCDINNMPDFFTIKKEADKNLPAKLF